MNKHIEKALIALHLKKPVLAPAPAPKSLEQILGTFTTIQQELTDLASRKAAAIAVNEERIKSLTAQSAEYESDRAKAVSVTKNINKLIS